jgi:hypothetical protein
VSQAAPAFDAILEMAALGVLKYELGAMGYVLVNVNECWSGKS